MAFDPQPGRRGLHVVLSLLDVVCSFVEIRIKWFGHCHCMMIGPVRYTESRANKSLKK